MKVFNDEGLGSICPRCGGLMTHRKRIASAREDKPYFFTEYDYCTPCKFTQHYEKYKVYQKQDPAQSKS